MHHVPWAQVQVLVAERRQFYGVNHVPWVQVLVADRVSVHVSTSTLPKACETKHPYMRII